MITEPTAGDHHLARPEKDQEKRSIDHHTQSRCIRPVTVAREVLLLISICGSSYLHALSSSDDFSIMLMFSVLCHMHPVGFCHFQIFYRCFSESVKLWAHWGWGTFTESVLSKNKRTSAKVPIRKSCSNGLECTWAFRKVFLGSVLGWEGKHLKDKGNRELLEVGGMSTRWNTRWLWRGKSS